MTDTVASTHADATPGPLTRLEASSTAIVIVDLQEKLLPAVLEAPRVLRAARLLLRAAGLLELPVVVTTQYARGLGPTVREVEELLPEGTRRLDKTAFSCFDDPGFAALLADAASGAARTLLVAGIESHICVAGTVIGARRLGRGVQVVTDAVSARGANDHAVGLERMERAGALPTTAEMAVYELLRASSGDAFRKLLPYLKE